MIQNYFKTASRHLKKNKLYSGITLIGLIIGITGCLFIGIYISNELSFDKFHKNAERIARVTWEYSYEDTQTKTAVTGTKVGPEFTRRFPETKDFVRLMKYQTVLAVDDKMFEEKRFLYVDSSFFKIFSFPLLQGDPATALNAPNKLVITESIAEKYFGSEDPLGKIINVGGIRDYTVTGVAANTPSNSQIQFDVLGSFSSLSSSQQEKWNQANYITYLLLQDEQSFTSLQKKIDVYMKKVISEEMGMEMSYHLEPLPKVHLHSKLDGLEPNSNITYIYILTAVALLILLIACVNYTNLSTAQAAGRSAEIGMRKVMGAGRKNILFQFLGEAFLLALTAVFTALIVAYFLMPYFSKISGKIFEPGILFQPVTLLGLLFLTLMVTILAGTYPALILSRGKVIKILKTGFTFTGSAALRRGLIVFQFAISVFLFISSIIILQQLDYIMTKDLGYNKDSVVVLPIDSQIRENYDALQASFERITGVNSVSGAYEEPTHIRWSDGLTSQEKNQSISITALPVSENIVETLNFEILAGTNFTLGDQKSADPEVHGDNIRYTYILNETAAKAFGWSPADAIGKKVAKGREGVVRAVIKDFHFRSLHEPIGPLVIFMDKRLVNNMFVKIAGDDVAKTLIELENTWKQRVPHRPFEYQFLDESYASQYKAEQNIAGVFTTFTTIAILLACLGLFALTAFSMVKRVKEIGIRKVLGASTADILILVSKDFVKLVAVAIVIAVPLSILAIQKWLESFSYRVDLKWWVFVLSSLITLFIALVTISLQALKTAKSNPVKNLRNE